MPTTLPDAAPLTPSWHWSLMTGRPATARLRGWVRYEQDAVKTAAGWDWTAAGNVLWAVHGQALTDEAARYAFTPFWQSKKKPRGDGFDAWASAFVKQHRY